MPKHNIKLYWLLALTSAFAFSYRQMHSSHYYTESILVWGTITLILFFTPIPTKVKNMLYKRRQQVK
jgi:hypothetical protein